MRIVVDLKLCESNGLCMDAAPDVFHIDGDDALHVLDENPDESLRDSVETAARMCPKQAISIVRETQREPDRR